MTWNQTIKKQTKVIVPENWDSDRKGKFWEQLVGDLLRQRGWRVEPRVKLTGMEADWIAYNPETYQKALVECKFQQKPINSNILNSLLGKALRCKANFAYLFSTSEAGADAKGIIHEEEDENKKDPDRKPILIFVSSEEIAQLFMDIKGIKLPDLVNSNIQVKVFTLLITPDQILWVAEEIQRGEPCRAIIFPTSDKCKIDLEQLSADFAALDLSWKDLEIVDGTRRITLSESAQMDAVSESYKEVVSPIGKANSFDDYHRPCSPQYFVGRDSLQEKFWDFIKNIKYGKNLTRIVCFSGRSGFGKSSLLLKLSADCFDKEEYKDSFYLYHVDVRSAKGALFVVSAIRLAIQKAIDDGFIDLPNYAISIESTEQALFDNETVRVAIEKLKSSDKVIIIFFDQFEEILTKESLLGVYKLFEKAAREVDSLKSNIVLGFCWRIGITMLAEHPAYKLWHDLKDKMQDFEVENFSDKDSKSLLKQFDAHLNRRGKRLKNNLKEWLLNQCPSYPWLLKKLCSDISNQILNQEEIVPGYQVDVKCLFDKDLERYVTTKDQDACLRYIAKNSPVAMNELLGKFEDSIIKWFEEQRLIIKIGLNYTIYWDIFREYILEGKVPTIPLSYRPRNSISKVIEMLRLLTQQGQKEITFARLVDISGQKKSKIDSIVGDLQNFFQVIRNKDLIIMEDSIANLSDDEIADYLANQLEEHIVLKEVYAQVKPGKTMTLWGFQKLLIKAYNLTGKPKTPQDYASRMLSWFFFAGLLEKRSSTVFARPIGEGKQKGKLMNCEVSGSKEEIVQLELWGNFN